jgi:hypothetical protein
MPNLPKPRLKLVDRFLSNISLGKAGYIIGKILQAGGSASVQSLCDDTALSRRSIGASVACATRNAADLGIPVPIIVMKTNRNDVTLRLHADVQRALKSTDSLYPPEENIMCSSLVLGMTCLI